MACSRGATRSRRATRTASGRSIRWASSSRIIAGVPAARSSAAGRWRRPSIASRRRVVAHYDQSNDAIEFANSRWARDLCRLGTSCPDHFLRTRICPMFVPWNPDSEPLERLQQRVSEQLELYRTGYVAYYTACAGADSPPLRDSNPSVVVIPALGVF